MAISPFSVLFFLSLFTLSSVQPKGLNDFSSPFLSPTTLFPNYVKMLSTFKIYIYNPPRSIIPTFTAPPESLFNASLLHSPFITQNPDEAHLFFIPFPPNLSVRSLSRLVRELRSNLPYWNRTLGADHFYMSRTVIDYTSDRNILELKKNSIQILCFPTTSGSFIPHKDITLPPSSTSPLQHPVVGNNVTSNFLGYMKWNAQTESSLVNKLRGDPEFVIESEWSDHIRSSKFCLFIYGSEVSWIGEAMALGCVPVVITDRPVQDLPLMDMLKWSEMGVFVGTQGAVRELKEVLGGISGDRYRQMRNLSMTASQHLLWNASPQPYDAFHMVMYQLWLRRHTIRYSRREGI